MAQKFAFTATERKYTVDKIAALYDIYIKASDQLTGCFHCTIIK